jgi:prepilin-type N-terminal cleavage/methylation domain-containing protein
MKRRRRAGFSYVEVLVVLTIMGILVRIALPRLSYIRKQAQSRAAIADVRVVRDAVLNFNQDRGAFPSEAPAGQIPAALTGYLPHGFTFLRDLYTVDYEMWPPGGGSTTPVVAVAIDSTDPDMVIELRKLGASGIPHIVSGSRTTFLLNGLNNIS